MVGFAYFVGVVILVLGVVFLYLKVIPQKYDGTFNNKLLQLVHDYFNFKTLYLETVLKFLFTVLSVACIALGVVGIITAVCGFFQNIAALIEYGSSPYFNFGDVVGIFFSRFFSSVVFAAIGPVVVRLAYESIMMFIMLVKNVIEINNKMKKNKDEEPEEKEQIAENV